MSKMYLTPTIISSYSPENRLWPVSLRPFILTDLPAASRVPELWGTHLDYAESVKIKLLRVFDEAEVKEEPTMKGWKFVLLALLGPLGLLVAMTRCAQRADASMAPKEA